MNDLEEMIYRIILGSNGITETKIASSIGYGRKAVADVLSSSLPLKALVDKDAKGKWHVKDFRSYLEKYVLSDPELILIIKSIIDNPQLRSLFDTTNILKTNEIGSVLEYSEWAQAKGDNSKYNDKKYFPRYRRININWDKLYDAIEAKGYSIWSLSKEFNISTHIMYASKRDGKMNPFLLEELCAFLRVDVDDICEDLVYTRVRNGVSHKRRVSVNWKTLVRDAKDKGYDMHELSIKLGKSPGYLNTCRSIGGINEDILKKIGNILNRDYRDYYDDRNKNIIGLVDETCNQYNI